MEPDALGWASALAQIALAGLLLAGCASPAWVEAPASNSLTPGVGRYQVGSPYEINGVWYYPAVDYDYDRTGVASWYGEAFEGRLTANGEIFDLNDLTAAHTTLPMPSVVQVTNLENGRSIRLRVNDRGPFIDGRLIDVSRRAAQLLGFETQGTAFVRVTILKDESIAAAAEAMRNGGQALLAQASAAAPPALASGYSAAATTPPMSGSVTPLAARAKIERREAPPPLRKVAMPKLRQRAPNLSRLATASGTEERLSPSSARTPSRGSLMHAAVMSSPPSLMPIPPASQTPPPRRHRFALIAPAEAAEFPPFRSQTRKADFAASASLVAKMPPSVPKVAVRATAPAGQIFVQAGAFSRRENAERVESGIARLGRVRVTAASVNGVAIYRVRLGPFESAEQARRLLARIVHSGYPGARIVGD
jgi:rare lipoprotein A